MTPSRLFFLILCLTTAFLLIHDRPISPTPAPSLNNSLSRVDRTAQRQNVPGYERALFGDWAPTLIDGHSCSTRHHILSQTFASPVSASCTVPVTHVADPYSGKPLTEDVQVDHIFPLRAAWDLGAHSWTPNQRYRFANDPLNLVAVSAAENQAKSDSLPSEWLPSQVRTHCWYARRLAHVAAVYGLPLPEADIRSMKRACIVSEFPALWLG